MKKHIKNNMAYEEIGERLRIEVIKHYKKIDVFGKLCGIAPSNLRTQYFSGKSIPGGKHFIVFDELGLDIHWILTGKTLVEAKNEKILELEARIELLEGDRKLFYESMRTMVKDTNKQLNKNNEMWTILIDKMKS